MAPRRTSIAGLSPFDGPELGDGLCEAVGDLAFAGETKGLGGHIEAGEQDAAADDLGEGLAGFVFAIESVLRGGTRGVSGLPGWQLPQHQDDGDREEYGGP